MNPENKKPWWVTTIIIIAILPMMAYPTLLSLIQGNIGGLDKLLIVFYPLYVIAAALCAWICYPRRAEITWILVVLMLLTHAAMWALVTL